MDQVLHAKKRRYKPYERPSEGRKKNFYFEPTAEYIAQSKHFFKRDVVSMQAQNLCSVKEIKEGELTFLDVNFFHLREDDLHLLFLSKLYEHGLFLEDMDATISTTGFIRFPCNSTLAETPNEDHFRVLQCLRYARIVREWKADMCTFEDLKCIKISSEPWKKWKNATGKENEDKKSIKLDSLLIWKLIQLLEALRVRHSKIGNMMVYPLITLNTAQAAPLEIPKTLLVDRVWSDAKPVRKDKHSFVPSAEYIQQCKYFFLEDRKLLQSKGLWDSDADVKATVHERFLLWVYSLKWYVDRLRLDTQQTGPYDETKFRILQCLDVGCAARVWIDSSQVSSIQNLHSVHMNSQVWNSYRKHDRKDGTDWRSLVTINSPTWNSYRKDGRKDGTDWRSLVTRELFEQILDMGDEVRHENITSKRQHWCYFNVKDSGVLGAPDYIMPPQDYAHDADMFDDDGSQWQPYAWDTYDSPTAWDFSQQDTASDRPEVLFHDSRMAQQVSGLKNGSASDWPQDW